jgi:rubredoxin
MKQMTVRMSDELWAQMEETRAAIPRESWVKTAIIERIARARPADWADAICPQEPLNLRNQMDSEDRSAAGDGGWSTKVVPSVNTGTAGGTKGASETPAEQPVRKTPPAGTHDFVGLPSDVRCRKCQQRRDDLSHPPY